MKITKSNKKFAIDFLKWEKSIKNPKIKYYRMGKYYNVEELFELFVQQNSSKHNTKQ